MLGLSLFLQKCVSSGERAGRFPQGGPSSHPYQTCSKRRASVHFTKSRRILCGNSFDFSLQWSCSLLRLSHSIQTCSLTKVNSVSEIFGNPFQGLPHISSNVSLFFVSSHSLQTCSKRKASVHFRKWRQILSENSYAFFFQWSCLLTRLSHSFWL